MDTLYAVSWHELRAHVEVVMLERKKIKHARLHALTVLIERHTDLVVAALNVRIFRAWVANCHGVELPALFTFGLLEKSSIC